MKTTYFAHSGYSNTASQLISVLIPTDGLIAYYPFSGNANDESWNNYSGSNYGATQTNDRFDNPNEAYSFDGLNDYIEISVDQDFHYLNAISYNWRKYGHHS